VLLIVSLDFLWCPALARGVDDDARRVGGAEHVAQ